MIVIDAQYVPISTMIIIIYFWRLNPIVPNIVVSDSMQVGLTVFRYDVG